MWTLKMTLKSMKMMIDGDRLIEPNYREDQEAICRSGKLELHSGKEFIQSVLILSSE